MALICRINGWKKLFRFDVVMENSGRVLGRPSTAWETEIFLRTTRSAMIFNYDLAHIRAFIEQLASPQSPWASTVVFAPKNDGSLRFCIDYPLISVQSKYTYPIPKMSESIDSPGSAKIFTTLDCNTGYWQTPLAKENQDLSAFTCHAGLYRLKRITFGLTNGLATVQRSLDIQLPQYKWNTCLAYLGDVTIYWNDIEDHFNHVPEILSWLTPQKSHWNWRIVTSSPKMFTAWATPYNQVFWKPTELLQQHSEKLSTLGIRQNWDSS